jgi:peptide/nickel transport system permease protein
VRKYALRRAAYIPLIALAVSAIAFFTMRLPFAQDPVLVLAGQNSTIEDERAIRADLGLDKPALEQYGDWLWGLATGDFGKTFLGRQPVVDTVRARTEPTFEILILSVAFTVLFGVTFGVIAAVRQNSAADYGVRLFAVVGQSVPDFFLLILLIVLPSIWWNYSPPVGGHVSIFDDPWANLRLYVPPTLLLAVGGSALLMRVTRSSMLEVLRQDYVRTARAKGLRGGAVVLRHALRNALIPVVTIIGSYIAALFFGAVVLERIFSINGLGQFFLQSAAVGDFPVVQFLVVYAAIVFVGLNLLVDLSYAFLDPRIQYT